MNRLVFRAIDKCFTFFKTLKQAFQWIVECKVAFLNLKGYLAKPPLLSPSIEGEDLFLYLVVSQIAVSSALIHGDSMVQ